MTFRTPDVGWNMIVNQNFFVEEILGKLGTVRGLSEDEMAYYREPFKKPEYRKPVWRWPNELPIEGEPEDVIMPPLKKTRSESFQYIDIIKSYRSHSRRKY